MSRQAVIKKDFNFVGGLVTDGGFLTSPQNAWRDGDNVIPQIDGHLERRVKIDLEAQYQLSTSFTNTSKETEAFGVSEWKNVGGNGLLTFAVVQQGINIRFYDCSSASLSPSPKSFSIDLTPYKCPTSPDVFGTAPISVSSGNGKLVIVSADTDPILVTYTDTTDSITVTQLTLKIRDFYGLPDTLTLTQRPATLTSIHNYNLLNQGWLANYIVDYFNADAVYPSDVQVWTRGKDPSDVFTPALLDKQDFGTSAAPKGRFILDAFIRDRSTAAGGLLGIPTERENFRPAACAFFAGRAWYSGIKSSKMGSWVMFSKVANTDSKYQECFQEGDPTAEFTNELISSDGGVIPIPNAGGILLLQPLQDSLIVFAQNGIWQILGDSAGFKADGYQVKQIASFGLLSAKSVVAIDNTVAFWSPSGIYILSKDTVTGDYIPKSLTLGKITNFYNDLQDLTRIFYVQGFYDSIEKVVYWLYSTEGIHDGVDRYRVDKILNFNTLLNSFYTQSIADLDENSPIVVGGFLSPNLGDATLVSDVVVGNDTVVTGSSTVVATITIFASAARIPKFLTLVPMGTVWNITFSDFINTQNAPYKFRDWYTSDTIGAETNTLPFIVTNFEILDDAAKIFQAPYIITYMIRTETGIDINGNAINGSSCKVQGQWEWTDSNVASRWSTPQQVYRRSQVWVPEIPSSTYSDGYPLIVAKSLILGNGHSLNLKFTSETGLDMKIAGWAMQMAKNTNV